MKKLKLLWRILQTTQAHKIIVGFVGFLLFSALLFTVIEPEIKSFGDGIWYCFAVFTTIGFGDLVAVTMPGRLLSVVLGLYGILVVALIPGIIVSYFTEASRIKANDSVMQFLDKLERLPELTSSELQEISAAVRRGRNKL